MVKSHIIPTVIITVLFFVFCTIDGKDIDRQDEKAPAAVPVLTEEEAEQANRRALASHASRSISKTDESILAFYATSMQKPMAVPVLSQEEAKKANREAINYIRGVAIQSFFKSLFMKLGLNINQIHFFISLLPLLLIIDCLFIKKKARSHLSFHFFSLSRRITILLSVSLLSFGFLVFVPWSIYFGNSFQFPFIFQDFVNWNIRVLTVFILGASVIILFIPPKISDYFIAGIAGLGLCIYLQAMFMNRFLGEMNGVEPDWSSHPVWGIINAVIWFSIVLIPFFIKIKKLKCFYAILSCITGIVLFLEILATSTMVFSASQNVWIRTDTYFCDGTNQFQFSNDKNVLVVILDTFGSEFVKRCFEKFPETKEIVKDFTWYTEARSNYHLTFPGLHHELTGTFIQPADNLHDLFEQSWHSSSAQSFYKQIKEAGYDARIYCSSNRIGIGPLDCYHEYFSNIQAKDVYYLIDYEKLHKVLIQISSFSSFPYLVKKKFFYGDDFFTDIVQKRVSGIPRSMTLIPNTNDTYLQKMSSTGIKINSNQPVFSIHYTRGAHKPWVLDEKCNVNDPPFDEPTPTTRSCFYLLSELINRLKEADIYDKTAILVCSDHGGNDYKYSTPFDMTIMTKPFNERKSELTYDISMIQSIDILPTLLYMACGDKANYDSFDGYTPSNIPKERERKVYRAVYNKTFPRFWGDAEDKSYKVNCLYEYNFVDVKSFSADVNSSSFRRYIQLKKEPKQNN